jgi:hypothetical protein
MGGGNLICFKSEKPTSIAFQVNRKLPAVIGERMDGGSPALESRLR